MFFFPFISVDVIDYCKVHSNDVLPDPDNCAKYYRCRDQMSKFIGQTGDCTYPDLFSTSTKACESFTTVNCGTRKEPQAPCMLLFFSYVLLLSYHLFNMTVNTLS